MRRKVASERRNHSCLPAGIDPVHMRAPLLSPYLSCVPRCLHTRLRHYFSNIRAPQGPVTLACSLCMS